MPAGGEVSRRLLSAIPSKAWVVYLQLWKYGVNGKLWRSQGVNNGHEAIDLLSLVFTGAGLIG